MEFHARPETYGEEGKTPVLITEETRELPDAFNTERVLRLRDQALIAPLVYAFARVGAAIAVRVVDVYIQDERTLVRLREKDGKIHTIPSYHNREAYLEAYPSATWQKGDTKGPPFCTTRGRLQATRAREPHASTTGQKISCRSMRSTGF